MCIRDRCEECDKEPARSYGREQFNGLGREKKVTGPKAGNDDKGPGRNCNKQEECNRSLPELVRGSPLKNEPFKRQNAKAEEESNDGAAKDILVEGPCVCESNGSANHAGRKDENELGPIAPGNHV